MALSREPLAVAAVAVDASELVAIEAAEIEDEASEAAATTVIVYATLTEPLDKVTSTFSGEVSAAAAMVFLALVATLSMRTGLLASTA
jgi:hypothetical protein